MIENSSRWSDSDTESARRRGIFVSIRTPLSPDRATTIVASLVNTRGPCTGHQRAKQKRVYLGWRHSYPLVSAEAQMHQALEVCVREIDPE
jgi:hypothetical protein